MSVISVQGLTKRFPVHRREQAEPNRIWEMFRPWSGRNKGESFLALDGVSFEVGGGEVVGILGRNGAGKSTLLKVLSRILPPSEGRAELRGRVGSLLEVGTGFHPELTGRENVFLSAALLGMSDAEARRRFDEIVDFSGVANFIDTPVKRYSSGMYMRLAFSVAAHLRPDILLIDEVLAVGDAEFQKKCTARLEQVGRQGQAVLFVSHNMQAVTRLCTRAVLLDRGRVVHDGSVPQAVAEYMDQAKAAMGEQKWPEGPYAPGDSVARLRSVRVTQQGSVTSSIRSSEDFTVEWVWDVVSGGHVLFPSVTINNEWGTPVIWSTDVNASGHGQPRSPGRYTCSVRFPANLLAEGVMTVTLSVMSLRPKQIHFIEPDCVTFQVSDDMSGFTSRGRFTDYISAVTRPKLHWDVDVEGFIDAKA